jgi:hypothetical protein
MNVFFERELTFCDPKRAVRLDILLRRAAASEARHPVRLTFSAGSERAIATLVPAEARKVVVMLASSLLRFGTSGHYGEVTIGDDHGGVALTVRTDVHDDGEFRKDGVGFELSGGRACFMVFVPEAEVGTVMDLLSEASGWPTPEPDEGLPATAP